MKIKRYIKVKYYNHPLAGRIDVEKIEHLRIIEADNLAEVQILDDSVVYEEINKREVQECLKHHKV